MASKKSVTMTRVPACFEKDEAFERSNQRETLWLLSCGVMMLHDNLAGSQFKESSGCYSRMRVSGDEHRAVQLRLGAN